MSPILLTAGNWSGDFLKMATVNPVGCGELKSERPSNESSTTTKFITQSETNLNKHARQKKITSSASLSGRFKVYNSSIKIN
jgi:hypothetical protein